MPKLKDYLDSDLNVFFNLDEFAEMHTVNGVGMPIIIDNSMLDEYQRKGQGGFDVPVGLYNADILFHVRKIDYGDAPEIERLIELDGENYRVVEVKESRGVYLIALEANRL